MRIELAYQPRAHQAEIHRNLKRFSVLVCHRRFGKTVLAINALIDAACRLVLPHPRYAYLAPEYKQAKAVAWDYLKTYTRGFPGLRVNESELWVEFMGGRRIRLFGADNPDALRGMYWDGVVLDEVAQMRPEVWGEIVRPSLADRKGWALFIGTPKGVNLFSELYYAAEGNPEWYAGMFRASDTGIISEAELAAARASMSESQYLQEFECDFTAATEDTLIPLSLALEATKRVYPPHTSRDMPVILGVDVARFGDDRSVIVQRQGLGCKILTVLHDVDTQHLAGIVSQFIGSEKADATFVDGGSMGAGVIDRLRYLGFRIQEINFGGKANQPQKYFNKRSEMWSLMRDWLRDGGLIPENQELINDLVRLRFSYDNQNRVKLESKEDAKKRGMASPDIADALALTFAQPVQTQTDQQRALAAMQAQRKCDPMTVFSGRG